MFRRELTVERLVEPRPANFDTVHFLRFITPLDLTELAAYRLQEGLRAGAIRIISVPGRGVSPAWVTAAVL